MRKDKTQLTENGVLAIGGVSSEKLAAACGTPLFVYDEAKLEKRMQDYKSCFQSEQFKTEVIYASKAFTCKALLHKLKRFGYGLDVVSGGELYLAEHAGFPMDQVYFHGTQQSKSRAGVGIVPWMRGHCRRQRHGMRSLASLQAA
jgi:diaminopimelate decarboxylase